MTMMDELGAHDAGDRRAIRAAILSFLEGLGTRPFEQQH